MSSTQMTSSPTKDSRAQRGGHRLFDHSQYPDAVILRLRGINFFISASYLALHSPFFYNLFYGSKSTRLNGRFELDYDPDVFGDLLDIVYPCFKKTNCCNDCSSSLHNRLHLALQLQLRLAVKRLLEDTDITEAITKLLGQYSVAVEDVMMNGTASRQLTSLRVSDTFPDATTVTVKGTSILVSATTLSLHSSYLADKLYKKGQLMSGVDLPDVEFDTFSTFIKASTGNLFKDCKLKFLCTLQNLRAKYLLDLYLLEITKRMTRLPSKEASSYAITLMEYFARETTIDMDNMKSIACHLSENDLDKLLAGTKLPLSHVEKLNIKAQVRLITPITLFVKMLIGKTSKIELDKGTYCSVMHLKRAIKDSEGISTEQQRFIFGGKQLEDEKTLGFYNIKDTDTVHLILKLKGC